MCCLWDQIAKDKRQWLEGKTAIVSLSINTYPIREGTYKVGRLKAIVAWSIIFLDSWKKAAILK